MRLWIIDVNFFAFLLDKRKSKYQFNIAKCRIFYLSRLYERSCYSLSFSKSISEADDRPAIWLLKTGHFNHGEPFLEFGYELTDKETLKGSAKSILDQINLEQMQTVPRNIAEIPQNIHSQKSMIKVKRSFIYAPIKKILKQTILFIR